MPLCMFRYAFDFCLNLPPDAGFQTEFEGREAFINCIILEGDRMFSFNRGEYNWSAKDEPVMKVVGTSFSEKGEKIVARKILFYRNKGMFSGGLIDPVKYSICELTFRINQLKQLEDQNFFAEISTWGSKVIINFINLYRYVSQETHIPSPSIEESPFIEILVSEDELNLPELDATFQPYNVSFNSIDPFKKGYQKKILAKEKINQLSQLLRKGQQVRIYDQLMLDAKEQAHIRGNYDLCVILAETAFEVYLHELLIFLCDKEGRKTLPTGSKNNQVEKNYREVITNSNIKELITIYLKMLTEGKNLAETKEYNKWHEDAYVLRNDIVHKGKLGTSSTLAEKAFMACVNYAEAIRKLIQ